MAVNDSGGCISSGAQGKVCLVRGWDAAKIHVNKKKHGFWWDAGGIGGYGCANVSIKSDWTG